MEGVSEGENKGVKGSKSNGGEGRSKPKRQMKTPFQLETLEKTYALEAYPSEAIRAELSEKLGLSDRQLQMWFCHRRLKDKREASRISVPPMAVRDSPIGETMRLDEGYSEHGSGSRSGSPSQSGSGSESGPDSYRETGKGMSRRLGMRPMTIDDDMPPMVRAYPKLSPPSSVFEHRAIALVEAQLGEPLREDGPILGVDFDPLPPDAFGAPIAISEHQKQHGSPYTCQIPKRHDVQLNKAAARSRDKFHKNQSLHQSSKSSSAGGVALPHAYDLAFDDPSARISSFVHGSEHLPRRFGAEGNASRDGLSSEEDEQEDIYSSSPGEYECVPRKTPFTDFKVDSASTENITASSDCQLPPSEVTLQMSRKRKIERVKMGWEAEAHQKQIRKELEKQDNLRRKREEQMRKEMIKQDRERRKEEERLMREKQREEERLKREQRREIAQREKFLQKESLRDEKKRQKEELRIEKEIARRKAATERATARRIARESMGLIDDEQLELMQLASSRKGLHSLNSTEQDTMQNLESLSDFLSVFPPESVKLKRPFAVQPWINSEENIGNLLMVWRFLISFADVLELWPFTLDEFVQAFHDSDSRLLCEVHVALLKLVIKDIEDVSWAPSTGAGVSQNCTAKHEGGHRSIVEGAYAWGFDISSWQHHLNALTWPEILRQLALSAGFGPQLKKRNIEPAYLHDNSEDIGCGDLISNLRNGSAAESAAAVMQEKGFSFIRRSRHLLTPGTVKFAAFHVLSLEGSQGITILELADKIQKSGLRDLTMSKAPEASIAAALSRDTKLFERTAPSTYCVRSPFRKDPVNAESILSAAREKLKIFESGFVAGEDVDVFERDEDSDCDVAEGSEVEDVGSLLNENKMVVHFSEVGTCTGRGKENFHNDVSVRMKNGSDNAGKNSSLSLLDSFKDAECGTVGHDLIAEGIGASNTYPEIDESKSYEPWVQGLAEGEYSALSVEERLVSLVSLVNIVNEGKSIHTVLENRLEAANALKKKMWAEAQLDKKHVKEESICKLPLPSFMGNSVETKFTSSAIKGCRSSSLDRNSNEASLSTAVKEEHVIGSHLVQNNLISSPAERTSVDQKFSMSSEKFSHQHDKYSADRSQAQVKSYIAHRAEEMYVYRSLPLGQDRRHNRYWKFVASASSNDPGAGRIFIELSDGHWKLIDSEEAFDSLLMSLDARGIREYHLLTMLLKIETSFRERVQENSQCTSIVGQCEISVENKAFGMGLSHNSAFDSPLSEAEDEAALKRFQDFQRWMWQDCCNSLTSCAKRYGKKRCKQLLCICDLCLNSFDPGDNYCQSCHQMFGAFDDTISFSKHTIDCEERREVATRSLHVIASSLPLQTRLLKALLAFIEVSIPSAAFHSFWEDYRETWGTKLHAASSNEDLLQVLTLLESAIKRDHLSSNFETTKELLGFCTLSGSVAFNFACPEPLAVLPWIPLSTAAVVLRLLELDASISYKQPQKAELHIEKDREQFMKLPSSYTGVKNLQDVGQTEVCQDDERIVEDNRALLCGKYNSSKCQRGGRGRGHGGTYNLTWHGRAMVSGSGDGREDVEDNVKINRRSAWQRQKTHTQIGGWGRRMVRRKRPENRVVEVASTGHRKRLEDRAIEEVSPGRFGDMVGPNNTGEWGGREIRMIQMEDADYSCSSQEFDEITPDMGYEHGNMGLGFDVAANGRMSTGNLMELSEDYLDSSREDDGDDGGVEGGEESGEGINAGMDSDGLGSGDGDLGEGTELAISDTSSDLSL